MQRIGERRQKRNEKHVVSFSLSQNQVDKNSTEWRHSLFSQSSFSSQKYKNARQKRARQVIPLKYWSEQQIKRGFLDGTIPLAVSDTGVTSGTGLEWDPFIDTN